MEARTMTGFPPGTYGNTGPIRYPRCRSSPAGSVFGVFRRCRRWVASVGRHHQWLRRVGSVVGRHDLDTVLVEQVLDIGVEGRQNPAPGFRLVDDGHQAVLRIEVGQPRLQHERLGLLAQTRSALCGFDE